MGQMVTIVQPLVQKWGMKERSDGLQYSKKFGSVVSDWEVCGF